MKPHEIAELSERNYEAALSPGSSWPEASKRIRRAFSTNLRADYALDLPEQVGVIMFDKAWESGHASGYHQVEQDFEELAEFARFARSAK